jgi:hypothetical protein
MKLHLVVLASLVSVQPVFAQISLNGWSRLNVMGDAAINVGTPIAVSSYSYGSGPSYRRSRSGGYGQSQNVSQGAGSEGDGIGADGTVALGKISVTATVSMTFQLQQP